MSLITLSMTAATFLFFQHSEYTTYHEKLRTRTFGINDPSILYVVPCTILYIGVNAPRIWANALVIAISPTLAIVTLAPDFLLNLIISHKFALNLRKNKKFPDGIVTGIINFVCPCGPVKSIGKINFLSSVIIAAKVCLLYPILMYHEEWTVQYDNDPDHLRCWSCSDYTFLNDSFCQIISSVEELRSILQENLNEKVIPRICGTVSTWVSNHSGEEQNDFVFQFIFPMTIFVLLAISVPFGFMITHLMRRSKIDLYLVKCHKKIEVTKNKFLLCWNHVRCKDQQVTIVRKSITDDVNIAGERDKFLSIVLGRNASSNEEGLRTSAIFGTEIFIERQKTQLESQRKHQFMNVLLTFLLSVRTMFEVESGSRRNENCK